MKKHKSVVAILLAVMMIFTMMPMMAFADTNPPASKIVSWGTLYATARGDNDIDFPTERDMDANGVINATAVNKVEDVVGGQTWAAPSGAVAKYYDLADSAFTYTDSKGKEQKLDGTTWTRDEFDKLVKNTTQLHVQLVEPSYTENYKAQIKENPKYEAKTFPVNVTVAAQGDSTTTKTGTAKFGVWELVLKDFEFDATAKDDQTVVLEVKSILPATGKTTDGIENADLDGTVAKATITVQGKAKTPENAEFYFDKVGGAALDEGVYDGNAHTVVVDETPGYTWSFQVRNAQGKFEDVSAVTITDVQETPIAFKAFYTDAKGNKTQKDGVMSLNLKPLAYAGRNVTIGWDQKPNVYDPNTVDEDGNGILYLIDGTEYDASAYIAYTPLEVKAKSGEKPADTAARVAMNEAAKNAVSANAALLKEYFNAYYQLEDVTTKYAAGEQQELIKISAKTLSKAEKDAADEKFKQLVANFGEIEGLEGIKVNEGVEAAFQLNADKVDYEIEFTKAPEGAKVIHIKKAKKLKKAKSFTVKAVSNKGVAVTYKLINANSKIKINKTTGKITLKKGLKKGTYKFKVKAYVAGHGSDWNYEIQNITVKIKK